jgi:hypothetical protein
MNKSVNPTIWLPVKVLVGQDMHPGKKELEYFYDKWTNQQKKAPFRGEYDIVASNNGQRLMTINPNNVSHCITDIRMDTYDPKKATVMVGVKFTGPRGEDASDDVMRNKIRFVARSVKVKDENGQEVDRLVTFDCMHAPRGVKPKTSKAILV